MTSRPSIPPSAPTKNAVQPRPAKVYSRAEIVSDAAVHVTGVLLALVGVPVLVAFVATWGQDRRILVAAAVYGMTLLLMVSCSAIYHMVRVPTWEDRFRRMDQTAIYLKIAGTYTPLSLMSGAQVGAFLIGIWGIAVGGSAMILFGPRWVRHASLAVYILIGWAGVFAAPAIFDGMSGRSFGLILAAGCVYTAGIVFHLCTRMPFHKTLWHVFVLTATALAYSAVLSECWGLGLDA